MDDLAGMESNKHENEGKNLQMERLVSENEDLKNKLNQLS